MTLLVVLTIGFCWIGATTRGFDRRTQKHLLTLIVVAIALDYARGIF